MKNTNANAGAKIRRFSIRSLLVSALVIVFFVSIILVFYFLLYSATQKSIIDRGELSAVQSPEQVNKYLATGTNAINLTAYGLENLISKGSDYDEILEYIEQESYMVSHVLIENTTGIYAYINGKYYDGAGWVPDEDYIATERPWYTDAMAHAGKVAIVDPYLDAQTNTVMMTLAKRLDSGGGVVALDITMDTIQFMIEEYSKNNHVDSQFILDSKSSVVAHTDKEELGKSYADDKASLGGVVVDKLKNTRERYFELKYEGKNYIVYAVMIENDWYSISVIDATDAYTPLRMLLLGTIAAIILSVSILATILMRVISREMIAQKLSNQITSTADIYMAMQEIDLVTNTYSSIRTTDSNVDAIIGVVEAGENAQDEFLRIMDDLAIEKYKEEMRAFIDLF